MGRRKRKAGGGLSAIRYYLRKAKESGGRRKFRQRLRAKNACTASGLGVGGQRGGLVDEAGGASTICRNAIQATASDMQRPIPEDFFFEHSIEELERWTSVELEHAGRLAFPIAWEEGQTHFKRITWDDALDRVVAELSASVPEQSFFYADGETSNEAAFLLQVLARSYGSANVDGGSSYSDRASSVALSRMVGSGSSTAVLDDLDRADLALLVGANPAASEPRMIEKLVALRRRGGKVVVINPVREAGLERYRIPSSLRSLVFGSTVSDLYLQPHVGADVAVFKLLVRALIDRGSVDYEFVERHVSGFEAVEEDALALDVNALCERAGLEPFEIDSCSELLARAECGVVLWASGLTRHLHGTDNVLALGNLAAARGWIGKIGAGLLPIRGHSNVQGLDSMGFAPVLAAKLGEKLESEFGISPVAGNELFRSMEAASRGEMRVALGFGGNLLDQSPDRTWAAEALRNIGTTCYVSTKLNRGHIHGRGRFSVVLPVFTRDEEPQRTTQESMFNFVRLSEGGLLPPEGELKSEVEMACALAGRLLPSARFPFKEMTSYAAIRRVIAAVVPGYAPIGEIDETRAEFQVEGRTFHEPEFQTASGKFEATVPSTTTFDVAEGELRLTTLSSEGQFGTVVYEDEDPLRGNARRDVVMIHPTDAEALGLAELDPVVVESDAGRLEVHVAFGDIPAGNAAMYYPEANVLVPRRVDERSGTPAFKSVAVRLIK